MNDRHFLILETTTTGCLPLKVAVALPQSESAHLRRPQSEPENQQP